MIRQVSVDDRLLHGQVAFYWTSYYNLDMILVLNDEAANDEFTKMILGLAKPREVRLQIGQRADHRRQSVRRQSGAGTFPRTENAESGRLADASEREGAEREDGADQ